MADAITLAQFYLSGAARLSDGATVPVEIDKAEALWKWFVESWPDAEILPSDIVQLASIRALRDRPAVRKAVATLVEAGWLLPLEQGGEVRGKARKEAYRIVRGVA